MTNNNSISDDWIYWCFFTITLSYHQYNLYLQLTQRYCWLTRFPVHRCTPTRILSLHQSLSSSGSQHRNYHFKSLWNLLVISSSVTLECWPNFPVSAVLDSVVHSTNLYSSNLRHSLCSISDWLILIYNSCYIETAQTYIAENTSCDRYSLLCDITLYYRKHITWSLLTVVWHHLVLQKTHHMITTHCCVTSTRIT
jgi:hypothetical protein